MTDNVKLADFHKWCRLCKYHDKAEEDDPCWDCLAQPVNYNTTKPDKFEYRTK